MYTLLIAEDEKGTRETVREYFGKRGFEIWEAADGIQAAAMIEERDFDIVLLDVMMPGFDGFQVCSRLRQSYDTPVVFLTARTAEEDQLRGFQLQADDYITKPFSLPVLHAKVCALIKRHRGIVKTKLLEVPGISIDLEAGAVRVDGQLTEMPTKVYDLLIYLMQNKNRILTREQILDHVWGRDAFCYDRAVDTTIKKLRRLLGNRAGYIKTIIKVGYKFDAGENK